MKFILFDEVTTQNDVAGKIIKLVNDAKQTVDKKDLMVLAGEANMDNLLASELGAIFASGDNRILGVRVFQLTERDNNGIR